MAEKKVKDLMNLDLYEILDVSPDATEKQIIKAYRKKALKCHPDKNPDNPKAADQFHQLSNALEVLTDAAAKEAYDKVLRARKSSELRNRALDANRKKLKTDLEARELSAFQKQSQEKSAAKDLEQEIMRLRTQGSQLLKDERARLEEEVKRKPQSESNVEPMPKNVPRLKVRWKAQKDDASNGGYSVENLSEMFSRYGIVSALLVSSKKKGSAIVEFESAHSALRAVQLETGSVSNPFSLAWISGQPTDAVTTTSSTMRTSAAMFTSFPSAIHPGTASTSIPGDHDFESVVLMRMRQAQERKRLIAQMQQEDEDDKATVGKCSTATTQHTQDNVAI